MPETRFVIGNRFAECLQRGRQNFYAVEIDAHIIENAVQLAPYVDGCFGFHVRFLR